ncbi:MAG: response regulator, partial [Pseudomonadota bacterium]|nr:response regulator [Pseudomonadota bacterium]
SSYPWKIVSLITTAQLQGIVAQKLKDKGNLWWGLFTLLFILSGLLLWIVLKIRQKERDQQERIIETNASLEYKIEERTRDLNESNKKLSTIIETTSQGFIMFDGQVRVVEINPTMLTMIGRSYKEVIGVSWFNLIGDENRSLLREKIAIRKKGLGEEYDMKIPKPDGSVCSCHFSSTPLLNEVNKVEGSFALVSDIGERLEAQQNLEKAKVEAEKNSAAKTLFLTSMSHEFRTPMNSILGFAQLLAAEECLGIKQKDFVEKILVSGDHLKKLIDDILDLARIEAGSAEINITNVDICIIMHELIATIEPIAEEREIELVAEEPETHYQVKADPLRFQQIILNLLSNAIKYNRIGGRVEVFCDKINDHKLRLHIVDDGPGISPDKRPFLFEPFNRLGAETSSIQGTGIGLAISKNLAELMDCQLGLVENDVSGCHFYIDLPLVDEADVRGSNDLPQEFKSEPSQAINNSVESCTLLYIEDNELNRMLLAAIIEKRPSFTLFNAVDGRQGVELALKELPDLILADIGLPDIDGFAVLAELQKHDETRKIPVVALSGNATKDDIEKAHTAGFVGYLTKPINVGTLFGTIDDILLKK